MAIAFGCCRHEQVRAIAPMSGGVWDSVGEACRTHAPAFRITIGLDDAIELPSIVQHLTDEFRSLHRCSKQSHVTDPHCNAYEGCDAPVIQCLYPGLAHQVPSEAGPEIWQFFRSFPGRTGS